MRQTKKADSGLVHTMKGNAANEHDITIASKLIREDDEVVYGASGYWGSEDGKRYRRTRAWRPSTIESTAAPRAYNQIT